MTAPVDVIGAWASCGGGWSPLEALKQAKETPWIVDGVIPANSIVWVVGDPACGKTFTMLDLAACVSSGRPWHGRQCDRATVVYVAAEGGADIHIRRACAELAAGTAGDLLVVQTRPMIAEPEGIAELMGLVQEATGGGITFDLVEKAEHEVWRNFKAHLTEDEKSKFGDMRVFEILTEKKENGEYLSPKETADWVALKHAFDALPVPAEYGYAAVSDAESLQYWAISLAEERISTALRAAYKHGGFHRRRRGPRFRGRWRCPRRNREGPGVIREDGQAQDTTPTLKGGGVSVPPSASRDIVSRLNLYSKYSVLRHIKAMENQMVSRHVPACVPVVSRRRTGTDQSDRTCNI